MAELWMPGATRLDVGNHAPTDGGPAKAIAHITWDKNATAAKPVALVPYETLAEYFGKNSSGRAVAPHVLWDPFTGRITQFVPANSRSKSLADSAGGTRTNRAGSVVIQVEALFFPYCRVDGQVYARLVDTPCKGWPELHAWVHSWGVPNTWPMDRPTSFVPHRSESVWKTQAGWYAHAHVPENTHQDPGSWPAFVGAPAAESPKYEPFPGASFFMAGSRPALGKKSAVFTAMGKRLVAVGCGRYQVGPGPTLGTADVASYEAWQRKYSKDHGKGWTGDALKWPPGRETWDALKVPNV